MVFVPAINRGMKLNQIPAPSFIDSGWRAWSVSLAQTLLLCVLVAVVITLANGAPYWLNAWVSLGYGLPIILAVYWQYRWWPAAPAWRNNAVAWTLGVLVGMAHMTLVLRHVGVWPADPGAAPGVRINLLVSAVISAVVFYFFHTRYRLQTLQVTESNRQQRLAEQAQALTRAELQRLQSQIEPHFLFNTLANVQALIDTEPESAKATVAALTRLLRTSLERTRVGTTTLGEEMAVVDAYLAIQAIRMGSRLQYGLKVPAERCDWPLPPLLVQPLVENAVLHGIDSRPEGGRVEVSAREEGGERVISVCDDGPGPGAGSSGSANGTGSNGIGLTNVRTRLAALYGDRARLTLQLPPGGGFCAELRLPDDD